MGERGISLLGVVATRDAYSTYKKGNVRAFIITQAGKVISPFGETSVRT